MLSKPALPSTNQHDCVGGKPEEPQDKEEPEEPLDIIPKGVRQECGFMVMSYLP